MFSQLQQGLKFGGILSLGLVFSASTALSGDVQFAQEAVKLCSTWIVSPEQLGEVASTLGYTASPSSSDGMGGKIKEYRKFPSRKLHTAENWFATTKICSFSTPESFSGTELDKFTAAFSEDAILGPFFLQHRLQQIGNVTARIAYLSKGSAFPILISIFSTDSETEFDFVKAESNKAN